MSGLLIDRTPGNENHVAKQCNVGMNGKADPQTTWVWIVSATYRHWELGLVTELLQTSFSLEKGKIKRPTWQGC